VRVENGCSHATKRNVESSPGEGITVRNVVITFLLVTSHMPAACLLLPSAFHLLDVPFNFVELLQHGSLLYAICLSRRQSQLLFF
jgi:hypothetical protein